MARPNGNKLYVQDVTLRDGMHSIRHAENAAKVYGVDTRTILAELGRRRMVGGQEDMIIDVALDILKARETAA